MCHGWTWVWESRVLFVFCFESNCNLQRVEVLVKSLGLFGLRYIVFVYLSIPVVSWVLGSSVALPNFILSFMHSYQA